MITAVLTIPPDVVMTAELTIPAVVMADVLVMPPVATVASSRMVIT